MTEEVKQEGGESQPQEQLTPVEQEAVEQGWVPKDQFQGDEHKWVEAGEFIRRGELFKKIEDQNRQLKQVRQALDGFKSHYTKVKETEYQRALTTLKQEFKLANREGDFEKADRLETEIESVEKEAAEIRKTVAEPEQAPVHPEFATWVQKNDWYATQPHMKTFADFKGNEFAKLGLSPAEVLKKVEQEVRKEFPNKFTNPNRDKPGAVESSTPRGAGARNTGVVELSEQERKVMNNFIASGVMTKEEYLKDLKKIKGEA